MQIDHGAGGYFCLYPDSERERKLIAEFADLLCRQGMRFGFYDVETDAEGSAEVAVIDAST